MKAQKLESELADWSRRFRDLEMTVDEVQDAFAALTSVDLRELQPALRAAVADACQELDAIRFGMCESGQAGEIRRIFDRLDSLLARPI